MTFEEYLSSLKGKTVGVIGVGVSNRPLIEKLLERGIDVTARDKKEDLGELGQALTAQGCKLRLGSEYLADLHEDVIFRTPGLRPDVPELAAAVAGSLVACTPDGGKNRYNIDLNNMDALSREYLTPLIEAGVDTLILGCTHYPLLKDIIGEICGPGVTLIDSGAASARALRQQLAAEGQFTDRQQGETRFYVSDRPEDVEKLAAVFLEEPLSRGAERIDIEQY